MSVIHDSVDSEETALLPERQPKRKPTTVTPLPKFQIAILLILLLTEPITSQCIYPFINKVCTHFIPGTVT